MIVLARMLNRKKKDEISNLRKMLMEGTKTDYVLDRLRSLCDIDCLKCKNSFLFDKWCSTKVTGSKCMYYECHPWFNDIDGGVITPVENFGDERFKYEYKRALEYWKEHDYVSPFVLRDKLGIDIDMAKRVYETVIGYGKCV